MYVFFRQGQIQYFVLLHRHDSFVLPLERGCILYQARCCCCCCCSCFRRIGSCLCRRARRRRRHDGFENGQGATFRIERRNGDQTAFFLVLLLLLRRLMVTVLLRRLCCQEVRMVRHSCTRRRRRRRRNDHACRSCGRGCHLFHIQHDIIVNEQCPIQIMYCYTNGLSTTSRIG